MKAVLGVCVVVIVSGLALMFTMCEAARLINWRWHGQAVVECICSTDTSFASSLEAMRWPGRSSARRRPTGTRCAAACGPFSLPLWIGALRAGAHYASTEGHRRVNGTSEQ